MANLAILSHDLWQRRFRGRRDLVGASILVGEQPVIVVGTPVEADSVTSITSFRWHVKIAFSCLVSRYNGPTF